MFHHQVRGQTNEKQTSPNPLWFYCEREIKSDDGESVSGDITAVSSPSVTHGRLLKSPTGQGDSEHIRGHQGHRPSLLVLSDVPLASPAELLTRRGASLTSRKNNNKRLLLFCMFNGDSWTNYIFMDCNEGGGVHDAISNAGRYEGPICTSICPAGGAPGPGGAGRRLYSGSAPAFTEETFSDALNRRNSQLKYSYCPKPESRPTTRFNVRYVHGPRGSVRLNKLSP